MRNLSLHELAEKLQEFIISQQYDAHNITTLNIARYNNLKIQIKSRYDFPNVVISVGLSESIYDLSTMMRVQGSTGPEEKYILKWLFKHSIKDNLMYHYNNMLQIQQEQLGELNIKLQGIAGEVKGENYRKRKLNVPKNDVIILDEDLMALLESNPEHSKKSIAKSEIVDSKLSKRDLYNLLLKCSPNNKLDMELFKNQLNELGEDADSIISDLDVLINELCCFKAILNVSDFIKRK